MQQGLPQPIALADYRAPEYRTVRTDLVFDIRDGVTEVTSTLDIERQTPQGSELRLDGQELELVSVELDGRILSSNEYQIENQQLILQLKLPLSTTSVQLGGLEAQAQTAHDLILLPSRHPAA